MKKNKFKLKTIGIFLTSSENKALDDYRVAIVFFGKISPTKFLIVIFFHRLLHHYPTGPGEYVFGERAELLTYDTGEIFYNNKKTTGIIQVSILCPQNLRNPFLLIRNKNERSLAPTCYTCGFKSLPNAKINSCKHSLIDRAIRGTYCISEINFALKLGYKILKIFSGFVYESSEPLLKDFISILGYEKLTSCKFDPSFNLKEITLKMCLKKQLTADDFKENVQKRNFTKLALNSFLGKFSQKHDRCITKVIGTEAEITKYFYSKTFNISDIFAVNKYFCHIRLTRKRKTLIPPNQKTNCIIGAQVVAFAREFMHQKMLDLEKLNAKIMYFDTDCLIFALKNDQNFPFKISPCFGDFKHEISEHCKILSFYSLGPKNFSIQYEDEQGSIKDTVKLRGVTLTNVLNQGQVDSKTYDFYLREFLKNKHVKKSIPQMRSRISKHKKIKVQKFQKIFFTNSIKAKRIINRNCANLSSFPYGFVE